jgi:hypothetical protein
MNWLSSRTASKTALLVFPDAHLCYSPSALNSAIVLAENGYEVTILCLINKFPSPCLGDRIHVKSLRFQELGPGFPARLKIFHALGFILLAINTFIFAKKHNPDILIGFDARGFLACRVVSSNAVYFSLEAIHDFYHAFGRFVGVKKLIIQSHVRKAFLFNNQHHIRAWIVPNSPLNSDKALPPGRVKSDEMINLIYCGGLIVSNFSIECIEVLSHDPHYRLTIKGPADPDYLAFIVNKYSDFIRCDRLKVDTSYVHQSDLLDYLSLFHIGFCIYPSRVFDDFNYLTSPSGKMYSYFASQLPCVGSLAPGLTDIEHYHAGVLIDNLDSNSIHHAIKRIIADYDQFTHGCREAAEKLDFRRHFNSFISAHLCG